MCRTASEPVTAWSPYQTEPKTNRVIQAILIGPKEDKNMKTLRNSSLITLAVVALALLVAAPVAMAGSVTYTSNTIPSSTLVSSGMGTMSVSQFNNTSGPYTGDTLNDIIVTLYGQGSVVFTAQLIQLTGTGGNLTINSLTTNLTLTATGASSPVNLNLTGTYTPGSPIVITIPGTGGEITSPSTAIPLGNVSSGTLTDALDLANFTGTGFENFALSGLSPVFYSGSVSTGYLAAVGGTTDAGGYATVEYDYNPPSNGQTPEPGTLRLFGTGLLGLAGMLRSRFSKAS